MRARWAFTAAFLFAFGPLRSADANPWTKDEGALQIISTVTISRSSDGAAATATSASGLHVEYGLSRLTLVADTSMRQTMQPGAAGTQMQTSFDTGWAGARVMVFHDDDSVVSVEGEFGASAIQQAAASAPVALQGTGQLRLMYGRGFTLWEHHGFAGVEAGGRWRGGPPADELLLDTVLGWEPWPHTLLLLQSFSISSIGSARGTYRSYDLHKVQFSVAQGITRKLRLQLGAVQTLSGPNARDTGGVLAVWWDF